MIEKKTRVEKIRLDNLENWEKIEKQETCMNHSKNEIKHWSILWYIYKKIDKKIKINITEYIILYQTW